MDSLVEQLAISTVVVSATVVINLIGLDALQGLLRFHLTWLTRWIHLDRKVVPLGIVLGLFVLHGIEIWLYALVYWTGGMVGSLEQGLYVSVSAYSSLGEAGGILPTRWRIIGVLEAINGMLLIGWSTAFLFHILTHLMWEEDGRHGLVKGVIAIPSPLPRRSGKGEPDGTNSSDPELMQ